MQQTEDFLNSVINRTLTVDELFAIPASALATDFDEKASESRIKAWCASSSANDWSQFALRLQRDGISVGEARKRLGQSVNLEEIRDVEWFRTAEEILKAFECRPFDLDDEPQKPYPFYQIIDGIADVIKVRLSATPGSGGMNLSQNAINDLLQIAIDRVAVIIIPPLFDMFKAYLNEVRSSASEQTISGQAYQNFVRHLRNGGIRSLISDYPMLIRIAAELTKSWSDFINELTVAISEDYSEVKREFGIYGDTVANISATGDFHDRGQCVLLLTLESGERLLFKPRDVTLDLKLYQLVLQLNRPEAPIDLRLPKVVACSGYGWTEYIQHTYCTSPQEVRKFYERCGSWLAIFKALRSTDMHEENVIACGEYPVPIDLETVLQPDQVQRVAVDDPRSAYTQAGREVSASIWSTGFLPGFGLDVGRAAATHGGLLQVSESVREISWSGLNSEYLKPVVKRQTQSTLKNMPLHDPSNFRAGKYAGDIGDGYLKYSTYLQRSLQDGSIEAAIGDLSTCTVRVLRRNTRFYAWLINRLSDYRKMRDSVVWSMQADFVSRLANWSDENDDFWGALTYERQQLCLLSVPKFEFDSHACCWKWGGELHDKPKVDASGFDLAMNALGATERASIRSEAEQIRASINGVMDIATCASLRQQRRARVATLGNRSVPTSALTAEVGRISQKIISAAFRGENSAAWLGLDWRHDSSVFQMAPMGTDLYNGGSGIALFLACVGRAQGSEIASRVARDAFSAVRHDIRVGGGRRVARSLGGGGIVGCGSLIYSMAKTGELIGDSGLLEDALELAEIYSTTWSDGLSADFMDGLSGDLCSLIALHGVRPTDAVFSFAATAGEKIIQRLGMENDGSGPVLSAGLSHGLSGPILALSRLAAINPSNADRYLDYVFSWVKLENKTFDAFCGNWPDARAHSGSDAVRNLAQWCHGAAGIGLSRLAACRSIASCSGSEKAKPLALLMKHDVDLAVETTLKMWPYPSDSLCCGSLAGVELLRRYGRWQENSSIQEEGANRLCQTVMEAEANGGYLWDTDQAVDNAGLFRGLAGVGLSALAFSCDDVPDVLCLS